MTNAIHFIITGGTIDKIYDPVDQRTKSTEQSSIPPYIENAIHPKFDFTHTTICQKDSLDLTDEDRQAILQEVQNTKAPHIVITHGTDTMSVTAEFLDENLPMHKDKTIVLTGALTPIKEFAMSDGGFNLGYAVSCAQSHPPGIYICMHGKAFRAGEVKKNTEIARFEETS